MRKLDLNALSEVLEHLTTAHHEVKAAEALMAKCGAVGMLEVEVTGVLERLSDLTEIAAAVMDAKMPKE